MCTVTFISGSGSYLLTSSRDEKIARSQAVPPHIYRHNNCRLLYPRDANAGGSWIALKDDLTAAVLLNGAFESHIPQPPYHLSRGIILLEIIGADNPAASFLQMDLRGIEPFTLVLLESFQLFECRWDGKLKYQSKPDMQQNYIWSSATLYNAATRDKRASWFQQWQQLHIQPAQPAVMDFHRFAGDGDEKNSILMNRQGELNTVSITSLQLTKETGSMYYFDLKDGATYHQHLFRQAVGVV